MKRLIMSAMLLMVLAGCDKPDEKISEELALMVEAPASTVDLKSLRAPPWERICVIAPCATHDDIEQRIGFKWDGLSKSSIGGNDGIYLLTFISNNQVVAYVEHPRNKGDFLELQPVCLVRENSVLHKKRDKSGWVQLLSNEQP
ncbi:MAG: hypothetical protein Q4G39_04270 [Brachymonas sp.]|nr:hypothetical protein [Brachymonas sp.]